MNFLEIQDKDRKKWNDFLLKNNSDNFLQSFHWGDFQKAAGKKVYNFAVINEEKFFGIANVIEYKIFGLFRYWYIPRGPVIFQNKKEIFDFFIFSLCLEAKKNKIAFIRIDSKSITDKDSFLRNGFIKKVFSIQPKDTLVLDIREDEETILSKMKQKTRYNIRLSERKSVEVFSVDFSLENFEIFWNLIKETSERDKITSHDKNYYYKLLEKLRGDSSIKSFLYFAKYKDKIIASNIMIVFGDCATYLHGASSNDFRNVMAPYLLQWKQICDAKKMRCNKYDFWGVTVGGENPKWKGITRFKEGFGGEIISYGGVWEKETHRILYKIYSFARKAK